MNYFFDTEFIESGADKPLQLISIGMVSEDDRTYYAISSEFKEEDCNQWVRDNVLPRLEDIPRKNRKQIAKELLEFIGPPAPIINGMKEKPRFWAYFADYDWVIFCQLFGTMMDLPRHFPMWCLDIKQLAWFQGNPDLYLVNPKSSNEHNALSDAQWNKRSYEFLIGESGE